MDYINYIKQSPYKGFTGYGGGVAGLGFFSGGMTPQALAAGGQGTNGGNINAIDIDTTGNATAYGSLAMGSKQFMGGCSNGTDRGLFGGGSSNNAIDYIGFNKAQNAVDFGDLTSNASGVSAAANDTRGIFFGGSRVSIDYVTIASTGNASDFGDNSYNSENAGGLANSTRALFAGGNGPGSPPFQSFARNTIQYVTIGTLGNASTLAYLTRYKRNTAGMASSTRGVWGGGFYNSGFGGSGSHWVDELDYKTISTTADCSDFGNLVQAGYGSGGCANEDRGIMFGGFDNTSYFNSIQYITISNTGNATDFGDLPSSRTMAFGAACSGGGLGA